MVNEPPEEARITVLVAEDDESLRQLLTYRLKTAGFQVLSADDGKSAIALLPQNVNVALLDLTMPEMGGMDCLRFIQKNHPDIESIIMTGSTEVTDAVDAMKNGAYDYVTKPLNLEEVAELLKRAADTVRLRRENRQLRQAFSDPVLEPGFIGETPAVRNLLQQARQVASLDSTVLITGESGVGKGVLARWIHSSGARAAGPLVTVSCTALPRDLVEAELFGHEKGAFTGALERRPGRVEMAEGGTLFLDEVGDMPMELQPKLLTFLQDRTFHRIGGNRSLNADVRVIAATHQDLKVLCREKRFREDLYFRLNVLPIYIPPLRERKDDIPLLARELLRPIGRRRNGRSYVLAEDTLEALRNYPWPGNVRELENALERATAFAASPTITRDDLPPELLEGGADVVDGASLAGVPLAEIERQAILQTLKLCKGNKVEAARRLRISEKSIYNKLKQYRIA